mgnify:FL=1
MKKKILAVLAAFVIAGTTSVFAKTGIGAQAGYIAGENAPGGALTFKVAKLPCVFAVDAMLGASTSIGVTADWWIANPKISGTWGYYYGVGLAGALNVSENSGGFGIGARALIGTNVFLLNNFLEFYAQAAWQPTIWLGDGGVAPHIFCIPVNIGFRFWF